MYPTASILPCFQFHIVGPYPICFEINPSTFSYNFHQFSIIIWPDRVTKWYQKSALLTVFECLKPLSFQGLRPWTPTKKLQAIKLMLCSLRSNLSLMVEPNPHFKKRSAGPELQCSSKILFQTDSMSFSLQNV